MRAWLLTLGEAAIFRAEAYERLAGRRDAFLHGFLIVIVVALLAALPGAIADLVAGLRANAATAEPADWRTEFDEGMAEFAPVLDLMGVPASERAAFEASLAESADLAAGITARVAAIPTRLPKAVGVVFQALGGWLSQPFAGAVFPLATASLAAWLGYGVWVMLAAKLLGGKGSLVAFFGTTGLFAVPHVLHVLRLVPYVGVVLAVIAFLWGGAIYVRATSVSHEISLSRALLAVLLPLLVAIIAGLSLIAALIISIIVSL